MNEPGEQGEGKQSLAEALFAEPIKKLSEERQMRELAARTVLRWLDQKESEPAGEGSNQEHMRAMVKEVREGLRTGAIFFVVKDPDLMPEPIKARLIKVHLSEKGGISVYRPAVALAVRGDTTLDQLLKYGDDVLEELDKGHKAMSADRGRITAKDNILIKEEGFGAFPESVKG